MRLLISGGCKMGKSTLAQRVAAGQGGEPVYVATMRPRDEEDRARIDRHRRERAGWGFRTLECPVSLASLRDRLEGTESLLVDSTTALLAEEMFAGGWDPAAGERVRADVLAVAEAFPCCVFVSDSICADGVDYGPQTEAYRRALAAVDRALAARCDAVVEMAFGQQILHKGDDGIAAWLGQVAAGAGHGPGPVHGGAGLRPLG